jgi:hypothetical protein
VHRFPKSDSHRATCRAWINACLSSSQDPRSTVRSQLISRGLASRGASFSVKRSEEDAKGKLIKPFKRLEKTAQIVDSSRDQCPCVHGN